jgi:hypothetical protein
VNLQWQSADTKLDVGYLYQNTLVIIKRNQVTALAGVALPNVRRLPDAGALDPLTVTFARSLRASPGKLLGALAAAGGSPHTERDKPILA